MTWPLVTMGDIFEISRGGSPRPIKDYLTNDSDGVNWVMISDASASSKYITQTKQKIRKEGISKSREVKPGDFLLTNSMSFGHPYIMKTSGCIHDGWLLLRSKRKGVSQDFFYHLLCSEEIYAQFAARASGATVKNLNSDIVREVRVPLPPFSEQKRIAEILDRADELRRLRQRAIAKLNGLSQSIFREMFGKIKSVPHKKLAEIVSIERNGLDPSEIAANTNYLGLEDIQAGGDIINIRQVSSGDLASTKFCFGPDHVLYGKLRPYLAKIALPNFEGICSTDVLPLKPGPEIGKAFLAYFLKQPSMIKHATLRSNGANLPRLSPKTLGEFEVPLPPIKEQERFASILGQIDESRNLHEKSLTEFNVLFSALQQRAFCGEL